MKNISARPLSLAYCLLAVLLRTLLAPAWDNLVAFLGCGLVIFGRDFPQSWHALCSCMLVRIYIEPYERLYSDSVCVSVQELELHSKHSSSERKSMCWYISFLFDKIFLFLFSYIAVFSFPVPVSLLSTNSISTVHSTTFWFNWGVPSLIYSIHLSISSSRESLSKVGISSEFVFCILDLDLDLPLEALFISAWNFMTSKVDSSESWWRGSSGWVNFGSLESPEKEQLA